MAPDDTNVFDTLFQQEAGSAGDAVVCTPPSASQIQEPVSADGAIVCATSSDSQMQGTISADGAALCVPSNASEIQEPVLEPLERSKRLLDAYLVWLRELLDRDSSMLRHGALVKQAALLAGFVGVGEDMEHFVRTLKGLLIERRVKEHALTRQTEKEKEKEARGPEEARAKARGKAKAKEYQKAKDDNERDKKRIKLGKEVKRARAIALKRKFGRAFAERKIDTETLKELVADRSSGWLVDGPRDVEPDEAEHEGNRNEYAEELRRSQQKNRKLGRDEHLEDLFKLCTLVQTEKCIMHDGKIHTVNLRWFVESIWQFADRHSHWVEAWVKMGVQDEHRQRISATFVTILLQILQEQGNRRQGDGVLKSKVGESRSPAQKSADAIAWLIKNFRLKLNVVEQVFIEWIAAIRETPDMASRAGASYEEWQIVSHFFCQLFPLPRNFGWGWSRIGWNWASWWKLLERVLMGIGNKLIEFDILKWMLQLMQDEAANEICKQSHWSKHLNNLIEKLHHLSGVGEIEQLDSLLSPVRLWVRNADVDDSPESNDESSSSEAPS